MEEKKISRTNWKSSFEKWEKIVEKTKKREEFIDFGGFLDLEVIASCGYCRKFYNISSPGGDGCETCPLFKKEICYLNRRRKDFKITLFWQYVDEMRISFLNSMTPIDWDKALSLATQIRDAIKEDEPKNK